MSFAGGLVFHIFVARLLGAVVVQNLVFDRNDLGSIDQDVIAVLDPVETQDASLQTDIVDPLSGLERNLALLPILDDGELASLAVVVGDAGSQGSSAGPTNHRNRDAAETHQTLHN